MTGDGFVPSGGQVPEVGAVDGEEVVDEVVGGSGRNGVLSDVSTVPRSVAEGAGPKDGPDVIVTNVLPLPAPVRRSPVCVQVPLSVVLLSH